MHRITRKQVLSDSVKLYEVEHPQLARKAQAGQFVIIRLKEGGERIPLTIADFDRDAGTITMVVQEVGKTTIDMDDYSEGDTILDMLGPLGHPSVISEYGTVLCVGGGLGVAPLYPIARELKKAGNRIITVMGARTRELLFWEDEMRAVSDELHVMTDDGSYGRKGLVTHIQKELLEQGSVDKIFAIGPAIMMKFVVETSRPFNVSTVVSLNTIMVDGTGMCGGCRVTVGGKQRFVCVDGPEFEGLDVDFDNLLNRQRYYIEEENYAKEYHKCHLESIS